MILTIVILVLFALFWIAELIAHVTRYHYGFTLSKIIWTIEGERLWGIPFRIVIAALVVLLFTHLEFQLP